MSKELTKSLRMLTFLKFMKRQKSNVNGRYINIMLSSMQILASFATQTTFMIQVSQEPKIGMITKAFVTLLFVTNVDDQFAQFIPQDIIDNADELNDSDKMYIG